MKRISRYFFAPSRKAKVASECDAFEDKMQRNEMNEKERKRERERERERERARVSGLAVLFIVNQLVISERRKINRQDRSDTKKLRFIKGTCWTASAVVQSFRSSSGAVETGGSSDRDRISSLKDKGADNSRSPGKKWSNADEPAVTQDREKRVPLHV